MFLHKMTLPHEFELLIITVYSFINFSVTKITFLFHRKNVMIDLQEGFDPDVNKIFILQLNKKTLLSVGFQILSTFTN